MKQIIILLFLGLWLNSSFGQQQQQAQPQFDELHFYESQRTPQMIYIKWYSSGNNPAPDFIPVQYQYGKPFEVKGIKMRYQKSDTVFFVLQDTVTPYVAGEDMLQYFIAPVDTTGEAGQASAIVTVLGKESMRNYFNSAKTEKLEKQKGILVSWSMNEYSDIKMFEVFKSRFPDKDFQLVGTVPVSVLSFTDLETLADVNYYYQIRAITKSGNKAPSSNVVFSASYNPNPPIPPYIELAYGVKGGVFLRIQLTDLEAAGVRIYRDNGLTPEMSLISNLIPLKEGESYIEYYDTLTMLSGRSTYTYAAVTESTSFIESTQSNKAYARPIISTPPHSPASLTVYEENRVARLFWENMEENDIGIAGYRIYRKEGKGSFQDLMLPEQFYTLNYYSDSTVRPGVTYTYKVHAVDLDGNISTDGIVSTLSLYENIPIPPFGLQTFSIEQGIQLEWSRAVYEDLQSVLVYKSIGGQKPVLIATLDAEAIEYLDKEVQTGNRYIYHITTKNNEGVESAPSDERIVVR